MKTKLLPCPFCGEVPQVKIRGARTYSVSCCSEKCFVQPEMSFIFEHERHAISPWNKRALTPKQEAAEELVALLDGLTLDGYGIFEDPRGQRWHLSLPITDKDSKASIASKCEQIASAIAKAGRA